MKIGILGTGSVARTLADKFTGLGHDVLLGTRDVAHTLATGTGTYSNLPPFGHWLRERHSVRLGTFAEALRHGPQTILAVSGTAVLSALESAGAAQLAEGVLVDLSNPLDFTNGMPPTLHICNTNSMGEEIQRSYPSLQVVKTLNSLTAAVMVDPSLVPGEHQVFLCGNDDAAKRQVGDLLVQLGWPAARQIDLGDITAARALEQLLPIWLRLWAKLQHPMFNFCIQVGRPAQRSGHGTDG
jgi:predicted dinucleotide-binding enzyme